MGLPDKSVEVAHSSERRENKRTCDTKGNGMGRGVVKVKPYILPGGVDIWVTLSSL